MTTLHLLLLTLPFASPFLVPPLTAFFPSCAGPGGEHIPHVECVSQTLLRVNQWDPEGDAELLIFGRPSYQKDVSKMIMNLAYYHRQLRAQSTGPGIVTGNLGRPWGSLGGILAVPRPRSDPLSQPGMGFLIAGI